jgi:four helix bundle protein
MDIGDVIHQMVMKWDIFNKNTIGYQIVRAADSISANISEGYGRFYFKEQRQFCYIARGSLYETKTWIEKASNRIPSEIETYDKILAELDNLHIKINAYIKYIERNL